MAALRDENNRIVNFVGAQCPFPGPLPSRKATPTSSSAQHTASTASIGSNNSSNSNTVRTTSPATVSKEDEEGDDAGLEEEVYESSGPADEGSVGGANQVGVTEGASRGSTAAGGEGGGDAGGAGAIDARSADTSSNTAEAQALTNNPDALFAPTGVMGRRKAVSTAAPPSPGVATAGNGKSSAFAVSAKERTAQPLGERLVKTAEKGRVLPELHARGSGSKTAKSESGTNGSTAAANRGVR